MIGKHVVITGGDGDLAAAMAGEFRGAGYQVEAPGRERLDVCDPGSINRFFDGRSCDLLICCAGCTRDALLARATPDDWDLVWQTNFRGAKLCAEAVLPAMIAQGGGHILFLSSYSALHPPFGQSAYAAAKRALLGLTQELAELHGPANIRVNSVLPGFLENRMTASVSESRRDEVRKEHALGRFNTGEQTARFVLFLHECLPHTSGQWFQLDSRPMRG